MNKALSLIVVCIIALCAGLPATAGAATFGVNTFGDAADALPVDNACDSDLGTVGNQCTLHAAIDQANATAGADKITFNRTGTGLGASPTITLAVSLPAITEAVTVVGGNCGTTSAPEPCVGVDGSGGLDGFVANANNVVISGLAITDYDATPAIALSSGSSGLIVRNTWLGLDLAGAANGNGIGVLLEGADAMIGGPAAANRNVIANSTEAGVRIFRGDGSKIQGNYFSTDATGNPGANNNQENIVIEGDLTGAPAGTPESNVIGGKVTGAALASPLCDGVCNLIVNAAGLGMDLGGSLGVTTAAGATRITGNHVGISLGGTLANPNGFSGINLGNAHDVVIGGADAGNRNYIGGNGSLGIQADDGVRVENNFIGLSSAGDAAIPDANGGASLTGDTANPVTFTRNRVGGDGSAVGLDIGGGSDADVTRNTFGVGTGGEALGLKGAITVSGSNHRIGIPDMGNVIGNSFDPGPDEAPAIRLQNADGNFVQGNRIGIDNVGADIGNEGNGIQINFGSDSNRIGGPTVETQNLIFNGGGDAISATGGGTEPQNNIFDRNRGADNGNDGNDLFIDLGVNGPTNSTGIHGGVAAPAITAATTDAVAGTAQANAVVRVFKKTEDSAGELATYVGKVTANGAGNWRLNCPSAACLSAPAVGGRVTASQTPATGSSELATVAITNEGGFEVDTTADSQDQNTTDGECYSFNGDCTLRAAIEQANATAGAQTITFDLGEMGPDPTIDLTAGTLSVTASATIQGCANAGTAPCVGVRNAGAVNTGFAIGAPAVTVSGLALSAFNTKAIAADAAADNLRVRRSWFGLRLDQTSEQNGTAVEVLGDDALIGGTTPELRNVFAANFTAAISLLGADRAGIKGNYVGTMPNGVAVPPNPGGIVVRANTSPVDPAADNVIGGTVTGAAATSAVCDGACNVISASGINLGVTETPIRTTVRGNFVGLNRTGNAMFASAGNILVGSAADTTVGGPALGDRNYIAANTDSAISMFDGGTVENNYVGLNSSGTTALGGFGVSLTGDAGDPVIMRDNRIAGTANTGAQLAGSDGVVTGNAFGSTVNGTRAGFGGEAISLTGSDYRIGGISPGDANVLAGGGASGELTINGFGDPARGDDNAVLGNFIGTNAADKDFGDPVDGIALSNNADGNVFGGDSPAAENVIAHVNTPIRLNNSTENTMKGNRGLDNSGGSFFLFFAGSNDNIGEPTASAPTATSLSGSGARPNATIRGFLTFDEGSNQIRRFLAKTTADGSGAFTLTYGALPNGACISIAQTDVAGNSSALTGPQSVGGGPCDTTGPTTTFDSGPTIGNPTTDTTPTFTFHSSEAQSTFQCRIDAAAFGPCSGPGGSHTPASPLAVGDHIIRVKATDVLGNVGATASRDFRINP